MLAGEIDQLDTKRCDLGRTSSTKSNAVIPREKQNLDKFRIISCRQICSPGFATSLGVHTSTQLDYNSLFWCLEDGRLRKSLGKKINKFPFKEHTFRCWSFTTLCTDEITHYFVTYKLQHIKPGPKITSLRNNSKRLIMP